MKKSNNHQDEESTLTKLYNLRRLSKEFNVEWTEEQERRLVAEEERIIRQEVLPLITESLAPALAPVERELVLVVDYVPAEPLRVSLSRKRDLFDAITDAVAIEPDPKVTHRTIGPQKKAKGDIAPRTRLRVTMPDGSVIEHRTAKDTLVDVVRRIGPERIRSLGITRCNVPIISNTLDGKYSQSLVGNGWYVITHSSTDDKRKLINRIAKLLHLEIWAEVIK